MCLLKIYGNEVIKSAWGNRCLVGALDFVSSHRAIKGDAAERCLADEVSAAAVCVDDSEDSARFRASLRRALSGGRYRVSETVLRRDSLSDFNDRCKDFAELRALILQARAAAMNDADCVPVPHGVSISSRANWL
jgi:hypothetical protein